MSTRFPHQMKFGRFNSDRWSATSGGRTGYTSRSSGFSHSFRVVFMLLNYMIMGFNLSCSMKSKCWLLQVGKEGENKNTFKFQNFKNVLFGYCFSTIYKNGRVIIFSELAVFLSHQIRTRPSTGGKNNRLSSEQSIRS